MSRLRAAPALSDISRVPGMLTENETDYLYRLARWNAGKGVIVEIGSYKGKSTICLARGSLAAGGEKVFAIDPHQPIPEEGYSDYSEEEFRHNIRNAGVERHVAHLVMTSEKAAASWDLPVRLLWIDGDHRYPQVRLDFLLWEPHVVEGGIIAFHDTIRKKGVVRVLWENVFSSDRFQDISIVDNITAVRKVSRITMAGKFFKWLTIGIRGVYIATRKLRLPYAKPAGRWVLKRLTDYDRSPDIP